MRPGVCNRAWRPSICSPPKTSMRRTPKERASTNTTATAKSLDKRITEEANAILENRGEIDSDHKSIVIYNKNWHKGIIGIVASRLTEPYYKPAVVLTLSNGIATG